MLTTVLIIVLILLLVGAIPSWGYSRSWGPAPMSVIAVVLLIVLVLYLTGNLNL